MLVQVGTCQQAYDARGEHGFCFLRRPHLFVHPTTSGVSASDWSRGTSIACFLGHCRIVLGQLPVGVISISSLRSVEPSRAPGSMHCAGLMLAFVIVVIRCHCRVGCPPTGPWSLSSFPAPRLSQAMHSATDSRGRRRRLTPANTGQSTISIAFSGDVDANHMVC